MKSIFICVVIVILGVSQVTGDMKDDYQKNSEACRKEANASEDDMKNFVAGGMQDKDAKDSVKCHIKCMMEKDGYFKNGVLDPVAAKKFLESIPEMKGKLVKIDESVEDCKNSKGANDCDTAFMITKCIAEHKA